MRSLYLLLLSCALLMCAALYQLHPSQLRYGVFFLFAITLVALGDVLKHLWHTYCRRRYWGCDITGDSINYVQLGVTKNKPYIITYGCLAVEQEVEFTAKHSNRWRKQRVNSACDGEFLLLREVELPLLPISEMRAALRYELEYQYSWYNESWVTSAVYYPGGDPESAQKMMVAFLKSQELEEQIKRVRHLGVEPASIELRSTAILRAARVLLAGEGDTLVIEHLAQKVICSQFRQDILIMQHQFSTEYHQALLRELTIKDQPVFQYVVYIGSAYASSAKDSLCEKMQVAKLLTADSVFLSASEIFGYYFPKAGEAVEMLSANLIVALGLAMREIDHAT